MAQSPLIARVKNGRLVLDEPTDLPEGAEIPLSIDDELGDDLTAEEEAALVEQITRSLEQYEAGKSVDGDEVIAELRARLAAR